MTLGPVRLMNIDVERDVWLNPEFLWGCGILPQGNTTHLTKGASIGACSIPRARPIITAEKEKGDEMQILSKTAAPISAAGLKGPIFAGTQQRINLARSYKTLLWFKMIVEYIGSRIAGRPIKVVPAEQINRLNDLEYRERLHAYERRGDVESLNAELEKVQFDEADLKQLAKFNTPIENWPEDGSVSDASNGPVAKDADQLAEHI
jgi:hypothetical protein